MPCLCACLSLSPNLLEINFCVCCCRSGAAANGVSRVLDWSEGPEGWPDLQVVQPGTAA